MDSLSSNRATVIEASVYGALMELLEWRYLAQTAPTSDFWMGLVLWLALGCELS